MRERLVINTGPIIAFTRADATEILARLQLDFVAPPEVAAEIEAGAACGHSVVWPTCIAVVPLAEPINPIAQATLDVGEAAVIQLAREQRIEWVCLDDRKGRRVALAAGLRITGSLGLLARAKHMGVISAIRPLTDRLMHEGLWYDADLLRRVLTEVGE